MKKSNVALNVVLVAAAALLSATTAPVGAQMAPSPNCGGIRVAFIDVQRVLARSAAGVAARDQLEREKAAMQREMDGKRVELEKLRDELEKKGPLMAADARRDKQDQFDRKRRDPSQPGSRSASSPRRSARRSMAIRAAGSPAWRPSRPRSPSRSPS